MVGAFSRSRTERRRRGRSAARGWLIPVVATVAIAAVLVGCAFVVARIVSGGSPTVPTVASAPPLPDKTIATSDGSSTAKAATVGADATSGPEIEVPYVVGKPVTTAEALMAGAGFTTQTRVASATAGAKPNTVVSQWPQAGAKVAAGQCIVLTYEPAAAAALSPAGKRFVVVIDPGHQAKADLRLEPIGPGSKTMKPMVAGGATGAWSHVPEYVGVLDVSLKLRALLEAQGVKVVMVRTTNNVDIPNSERARIGNRAHADLVVRVHMNASSAPSVHGVQTLYPSGNSWVTPIVAPSRKAAGIVESAVVQATGASSMALVPSSDMSGFNYSTVPSILVECGFMSNHDEDLKMATESYRQKLAQGMANGVMAYLKTL